MGYEISTLSEIKAENRLAPSVACRQDSARYAVSAIKSKISSAISYSSNLIHSYHLNDSTALGMDITEQCIYVCQLENHVDHRTLTSYSSVCMEGKFIGGEILGKNIYSVETKKLIDTNQLQNKKIDISLPVANSIIKHATISKMDDTEIRRAIKYGSLWKNLINQEDSCNNYSIFYQIIRREESSETMDILLVATKLENINTYNDLIRKSAIDPIIIDAKNISLDYTLRRRPIQNYKQGTIFIELGLENSYIMVMGEEKPRVFDMPLSRSEQKAILGPDANANATIMDSLVSRYKARITAIIEAYRRSKRLMVIEDIYISSSAPLINDFTEKLSEHITNCNIMEFSGQDYISINDNFYISNNNNRSLLSKIYDAILPTRKRYEEWVEVRKSTTHGVQYFHHYNDITDYADLPIKIGNFNPERMYLASNKSTMARTTRYPYYFAIAASVIAAFITFKSYCDANLIAKQLSGRDFELSTVKAQYTERITEIANLSELIDNMDNISAISADINIQNNQDYVIAIYNYLDTALQQGVWLKQLNFTAPNDVEIEGRSLDDSGALSFLSSLNNNKVFSKVSLKHMQSLNERDIYSQETIPLKSFLFEGKISKGIQEFMPKR